MDWRILLKIGITAIIVVAISEISKRWSFAGAIVASLPLTSLLALTWLYTDTGDRAAVSKLSSGILLAVIPSLSFFIILPLLLKTSLPFFAALLLSCLATAATYYLFFLIVPKA